MVGVVPIATAPRKELCGLAHPKNATFIAFGPCNPGFFVAGNTDAIDLFVDDCGNQQCHSMAVGICFHHGTKLSALGQRGIDPVDIVLERRATDFNPRIGLFDLMLYGLIEIIGLQHGRCRYALMQGGQNGDYHQSVSGSSGLHCYVAWVIGPAFNHLPDLVVFT